MRFVALFTEGRTLIPLVDEPTRVWRWCRADEPGSDLDIALMQHMDRSHDWSWRVGTLRYSFSDRSPAWIILQYGESEPVPCPSCGTPSDRLLARFCMQCAHRLYLEITP